MTIDNWLIIIFWFVFLVYWFISGVQAKKTIRRSSSAVWRILGFIVIFIIFQTQFFQQTVLQYQSAFLNPFVRILGVLLSAVGIGFAIWARAYLGRNWGMPMSVQKDADLVTTGPYAYVRHPIYTGIILATLGSALVVGLWWLAIFLFCFIYFVYSATVEEKILLQEFPESYTSYKSRTKMLIPFIF